MPQPNDPAFAGVGFQQVPRRRGPRCTIIAVIEMSQSSWLVAGVLSGIERQPRKKLEPSPERLLAVLHRWRDEAVTARRTIARIALAFEAGRDRNEARVCRFRGHGPGNHHRERARQLRQLAELTLVERTGDDAARVGGTIRQRRTSIEGGSARRKSEHYDG
jgi:hypothetical protein